MERRGGGGVERETDSDKCPRHIIYTNHPRLFDDPSSGQWWVLVFGRVCCKMHRRAPNHSSICQGE